MEIKYCFSLRMIRFSSASLKSILNEKDQKSNLKKFTCWICAWTDYIYLIYVWLLLRSNYGDMEKLTPRSLGLLGGLYKAAVSKWGGVCPVGGLAQYEVFGVGLRQSMKNHWAVWLVGTPSLLLFHGSRKIIWSLSTFGVEPNTLAVVDWESSESTYSILQPRLALWLSGIESRYLVVFRNTPFIDLQLCLQFAKQSK